MALTSVNPFRDEIKKRTFDILLSLNKRELSKDKEQLHRHTNML